MAKARVAALPQHIVGNLTLQTDGLDLNEDGVELNCYFLILVLPAEGLKDKIMALKSSVHLCCLQSLFQ